MRRAQAPPPARSRQEAGAHGQGCKTSAHRIAYQSHTLSLTHAIADRYGRGVARRTETTEYRSPYTVDAVGPLVARTVRTLLVLRIVRDNQ
jgi:hypothetical protein